MTFSLGLIAISVISGLVTYNLPDIRSKFCKRPDENQDVLPCHNSMLTSPRPSVTRWTGVLHMKNLTATFNGWVLKMTSQPIPRCRGPLVAILGGAQTGASAVRSVLLGESSLIMEEEPTEESATVMVSCGSVKGRDLAFVEIMSSAAIHDASDGMSLPHLDDSHSGNICSVENDSQLEQWQQPSFPQPTRPSTTIDQFARDVSLSLCDLLIHITNGIGDTPSELEQTAAMCAVLKARPNPTGKVIIIHNFLDAVEFVDFNQRKKQTRDILSWCEYMNEIVEFNGKVKSITFMDGRACDSRPGAELEQHFFIAKNGSPAGVLNPWVMAKILNLILSVQLDGNKFDLKPRLEAAINEALPKYLKDIDSPEVQIDLAQIQTHCVETSASASGDM